MTRKLLLSIGAVAIVLVSFFGTLFLMNYATPLCPRGATVEFQGPFPKWGLGFAYSAAVPSLENRADSPTSPARSSFFVCENGYRLGPPHTPGGDIAGKGSGRFSHWTSSFIFSASDNSDPNTNGRRYGAASAE